MFVWLLVLLSDSLHRSFDYILLDYVRILYSKINSLFLSLSPSLSIYRNRKQNANVAASAISVFVFYFFDYIFECFQYPVASECSSAVGRGKFNLFQIEAISRKTYLKLKLFRIKLFSN